MKVHDAERLMVDGWWLYWPSKHHGVPDLSIARRWPDAQTAMASGAVFDLTADVAHHTSLVCDSSLVAQLQDGEWFQVHGFRGPHQLNRSMVNWMVWELMMTNYPKESWPIMTNEPCLRWPKRSKSLRPKSHGSHSMVTMPGCCESQRKHGAWMNQEMSSCEGQWLIESWKPQRLNYLTLF